VVAWDHETSFIHTLPVPSQESGLSCIHMLEEIALASVSTTSLMNFGIVSTVSYSLVFHFIHGACILAFVFCHVGLFHSCCLNHPLIVKSRF
jgi:hypothetical protein